MSLIAQGSPSKASSRQLSYAVAARHDPGYARRRMPALSVQR